MKIGIIKEGKFPTDSRTPLSPQACLEVMDKFPFTEIYVQPSTIRCYKDEEYSEKGIKLKEDLRDCDILLGIKEVPVNELIPQKTYLFFSHTIKKQPHNRHLLIELLNKQIRMIDYETLTDPQGQRLIAFGRYAGIVGAYNGVIMCGKRYQMFELLPAHKCFDVAELFSHAAKVTLPPIKIAVTGDGRVASGALETLRTMHIKQVSPDEYLQNEFQEAVFTQLPSSAYHARKDGASFELAHFFKSPQDYKSDFWKFATQTDLLIAAAYWDTQQPVLFSKEQMKNPDFRIKMIADITCDINGSIPSTLKACSIANPVYDYNPHNGNIEPPFSSAKNINVMAVDTLPNELPRDASISFGQQLINNVLPHLLVEDHDAVIERATICIDGKLTRRYEYLQDMLN